MCNKSESIAKLAVALVKFNAEVRIIEKDAKNPHFKNQYASLDNIIDEVRPILAKHGLSVLQFPSGDGDKFSLRSMLLHESGEWIESEPIVMRPVKNDPQGIGSCATYARRYSLSALLSLNTGEDDDGNDASHPGKAAPITPPASLRAKYQAGKGDMDGFEEWVKDMQTKGQTFTDMENMLAKKLMEKKGGTASA
ncbi:ERF family protein [Gorillibacterium sp. CAU 1737]|uniref:ERF family protein n=1 Tax=Gorillibacterium sp. CAU 1737 TaxID=3140362 RepID=UPI003260B62C